MSPISLQKGQLKLMIESFLGTIVLCVILIASALSLIQYIGIKAKTKTVEPEITYIGDYVQSIVIYLVISSLGLLIYIYIYFKNTENTALYNSGLLFILYSAISGLLINFIYYIIMKFIMFFDKTKSTYFLKTYERNWTWIFIMIAYAIYYFCNNLNTYSFAYIALILSFLFWMHPTKSAFKDKLTEFKSLSRSYWCCLVFILICGFAAIRYRTPTYTIASFIGIILGFIIGIFLMALISNKMKTKSQNM